MFKFLIPFIPAFLIYSFVQIVIVLFNGTFDHNWWSIYEWGEFGRLIYIVFSLIGFIMFSTIVLINSMIFEVKYEQ